MALGGYGLVGLGVDPALKKAPLLKDLGAELLASAVTLLGVFKALQTAAKPGKPRTQSQGKLVYQIRAYILKTHAVKCTMIASGWRRDVLYMWFGRQIDSCVRTLCSACSR